MSSTQNSHAIQALLGGLMGTFSSGTAVFTSTEGTGVLPGGSFWVPEPKGEYRAAGAVFVTPNPDTEDGSWPITGSGTEVPVEAMQGGLAGNTGAGTDLRAVVPIDGVEDLAVAGEIEGGEDSTDVRAIKQLIYYKSLDRGDFAQFFEAQLGEYPAAVLAWERSLPLDGAMVASPGQRQSRSGMDTMRFKHSWVLFIVSTHRSASELRTIESDLIRDEVIEELFGRTGTRGIQVSGDPGLSIVDAGIKSATEFSYIDVVRFESIYSITKRRAESMARPWLKTKIVAAIPPNPAAAEGEPQASPIVMVDTVEPMPLYGPDGPVPDEFLDDD